MFSGKNCKFLPPQSFGPDGPGGQNPRRHPIGPRQEPGLLSSLNSDIRAHIFRVLEVQRSLRKVLFSVLCHRASAYKRNLRHVLNCSSYVN